MTEIRTERLLLRRARLEDVGPIHALLSHPAAMTYWSSLPHTTLEQTRNWVEGMIGIPPEEGDDFIVECDGRVIGKAGFWRFPEVGYALHPDVWGQGLGLEALRAVLRRGFETLGLDVVKADVDPRNEVSLRLLGRVGFVETERVKANFELGGEWLDSVYLQLSREDWARLA